MFHDRVGRLGLPSGHRIRHISEGQRSQVGLDAGYRRLFLDYLVHYAREEGKTVLVTSHVVQDMERLVDDVILLRRGTPAHQTALPDFMADSCAYHLPATSAPGPLPVPAAPIHALEREADGALSIFVFAAPEPVSAALPARGIDPAGLTERPMTLEDAFVGNGCRCTCRSALRRWFWRIWGSASAWWWRSSAFRWGFLALSVGAFFPVEFVTSALSTAAPWVLGGIVGYLGAALVLLESDFRYRAVNLAVAGGSAGLCHRTADAMVFLNVDTLTPDPDLTARFTAALRAQGFVFPARLVAGKQTILKPWDAGALSPIPPARCSMCCGSAARSTWRARRSRRISTSATSRWPKPHGTRNWDWC
ncbi:uncharacterized protein DUF4857 [Rhodovulum euryhalinum]|uniref:Uncharacterized protein DUF4857 n=1 Tax=Rhodovulum euryhalinum TaxID=35805 RepID=A0A4R2KHU0_9RHOB|nr:DUF4857 domain-containing protein [Rhodovulum euryhalinum]TCO70079.1 uncharacterized protein DUF4857 [Rhodovulum euryhalinum]